MSSENRRDEDERDEDERDEDERDEDSERPEGEPEAEAGPDPNVPRNRAERRAAAKAARRGRTAQLSDPSLTTTATVSDEESLVEPTTSIGGGTPALHDEDEKGNKRPKVPPRTMRKGTGTAEGVPQWARDFASWFGENRSKVFGGALVIAAVVGGTLAWQNYTVRTQNRAADAYAQGLDAFFAAVLPEDPPADQANRFRGPRFRTEEARVTASLDKFRRAEQQNPASRMAPLAKLSEASVLYQLGRYAEARQLYQSILGQNLAGLEGRALEGLAFTLESLGDLDGAASRYRELQNAQGGIYRDHAQFYLARLYVRRDDKAHAKDLLHGVTERLARVTATDPTAASQQQLREQAFTLLRDIDPQDPAVVAHDRANSEGGGGDDGHGHGSGGRDPLESLPPELREQLRRAIQQRSKQGR